MIISASRRTDIPAFFGEWFVNRLRAGEVLVRNPLNRKQVSTVPLDPAVVDGIVFWTKNPGPFLKYLPDIDAMGHRYYFTVTVNPYGRNLEGGLPPVEEVVGSVRKLAERIGPEKVIWRYDPLFYGPEIDYAYHREQFARLAGELSGSTEKCVFSFLEEYGKIAPTLGERGIFRPAGQEQDRLIESLAEIGEKNSLTLAACAQDRNFSSFGVLPNRCIDPDLIGRICGYSLDVGKDGSQRPACGCAASRDIGSYNTCLHGCVYCYANLDRSSTERKAERFDPLSPLLCDKLAGNEKVSEVRNFRSLRKSHDQPELFD